MDRLDQDLSDHKQEDGGQFEALRTDIKNAVTSLGARIDALGHNLQSQIDRFTLDKARAEGKAEGIKEVTNAAAKPTWWQPYARWAITSLVVGAVGLVVMLVTTIWNLEQEKITALQRQPATAVMVNPAPAPLP